MCKDISGVRYCATRRICLYSLVFPDVYLMGLSYLSGQIYSYRLPSCSKINICSQKGVMSRCFFAMTGK